MTDKIAVTSATPPPAVSTPLTTEEMLRHIDASIDARFSEFEKKLLKPTDVQAMIDDALKNRPTLQETQSLISATQALLQEQIKAANEAVVTRVENMVNNISAQLSGVNVMLAEAKGTQAGLHRVVEVVIKQHDENSRRITNIEADTHRIEARLNAVKTDVDRNTDIAKAHENAITSMKQYFEEQKVWTKIKGDFVQSVTGVIKHPAFVRIVAAAFSGASIGGIGWAILNLLGQ